MRSGVDTTTRALFDEDSAPRREPLIVVGIILAGMILRMAGWISLIPRTAETWHVAVSLATTGQFADVFRPGSGPTAHVAPVMPLMGFTVMLPHSLYQMSFWIWADKLALKPARINSSTQPCARTVAWPEGSPTIRPLPK